MSSQTGRVQREKPREVYFTGAGAVITQRLEAKNLKREDLAKKIGCDAASIWRYEKDKSPLSIELIEKMAKPLGTTPTALMQECLVALRSELKNSPFGRAMQLLVSEGVE
jgi:transcriptional regulator with XRE-family HTH domain